MRSAGCRPETIPELLARGGDDSIALTALDRPPTTYRTLRNQITSLAGRLDELGIERSDRIALVIPNGPEMVTAFLAVTAAAVAAPLNPAYTTTEFGRSLSDIGVAAVILPRGYDSPVREAAGQLGIAVLELSTAEDETLRVTGPGGEWSQRASAARASRAGASDESCTRPRADIGKIGSPDDVALILHTSGTTSRPKRVPLTHESLCLSAHNVAETLQLGVDDRCLGIMPLFHIHGLVASVLASLAAGGSIACTSGFDAHKFFEWVRTLRPTWYTGVPTMHQAILLRAGQHRALLADSGLRLIRSSSAPLPQGVLARLEEAFGVPVVESYGMTEAAHQIASNPLPPGRRKPGSVGRSAGAEIAVLGAEGGFAEPGQTGPVVIRGRSLTSGYEDAPEANRESFVDGWFRTGDEGWLDDDGYLTLTGRLKEIINRGGEKINPREIDDVLNEHPSVYQAVAFAVAHELLGEEVAAAVVAHPGCELSADELRGFAAAKLARFKVPRRIVMVEEIPKGPSGKLQRLELPRILGLDPPRSTRVGEP